MITEIKKIIPNKIKRNSKLFIRNIIDSLCYYLIIDGFFSDMIKSVNKKNARVVFVCKGNVCRSVFAEYRLKNMLTDSTIVVESCGINVDQGHYPPKDSVDIAEEYSCYISKRPAKGLKDSDIRGADLIVPMEYWQYKKLVELYPDKVENIILLRTLLPFPYCLFCNIADPYVYGKNEFRRSYGLIDRSLQAYVRKSLRVS